MLQVIVLVVYCVVALLMCAFIMANESASEMGRPSPIGTEGKKSTESISIVERIISTLAVLFIGLCIVLSRIQKPNLVSKILAKESSTEVVETKSASDQQKHEDDLTGKVLKPILEETHHD